MADPSRTKNPGLPDARLCLGVAGHRALHQSYACNAASIEAAFCQVLDIMQRAVEAELGPEAVARTRIHSLLADGADQLSAREAIRRNWQAVVPLPVGAALNCAINARPGTREDARLILEGGVPKDPEVARRADALRHLYRNTQLFELKDADSEIERLFLSALGHDSADAQAAFDASISARVALAARIVLEQSDIILAIWDGASTSSVGGSGHTVQAALELGAPVVLINPDTPEDWRILRTPEALFHPPSRLPEALRDEQLGQLVRGALKPAPAQQPDLHRRRRKYGVEHHAQLVPSDEWHQRSASAWHAYRRIEALFGGGSLQARFRPLRQVYEAPESYARNGGRTVVETLQSAPGADPGFCERVTRSVLPRFAWTDGIAAYFSDRYRSGMIINFGLSAMAIIGGLAYLPLVDPAHKWLFALFEIVLLAAIVVMTHHGRSTKWHGRWFETRRAAEYLRHAPILLALGAARAPGRWPRGAGSTWPEWYARHALREVGLPRNPVTTEYLRHCLGQMLDHHVVQQRDYHRTKAQRLTSVHHSLDQLSELLFQMAVAAVALFLALQVAAWYAVLDDHAFKGLTKVFTFLGVALPTLGGAIAGIRYFGDFERFAAISDVTSQKLDAIHERIRLLLRAPDGKLDYASVANLAHAADDIVVAEIENWQAVFGGKQFTVPV